MQLRHLQTLLPPTDGASKVTACAWSPNNAKLAVVTVDRVVHLLDENGEKQDKFSAKAADSSKGKNFVVTGLAWSPDSTKLAVAQSDCVVFVYKLASSPETATKWGEKKSICNKFLQQSPVTCLTWPLKQPHCVVFGLADGKVRVGNLKTQKTQTLFPSSSFVCSLTNGPDGQSIMSGHVDGTINRFSFEGGAQGLFAKHSCAPYALAWGQHVAAAGADKRLVFYEDHGRIVQHFDYSKEAGEREITVLEASPSGQAVVAGSYDTLRVFNHNARRGNWDEAKCKKIANLYSVTSMRWKYDGSRLIVGTLCGAVEMFDCCLRKTNYKGKFDMTYVGPSQVIVKSIATGTKVVLKSHYNYEIQKVNVMGGDRYLVASTSDTLLLGDLQTCKLSEIAWRHSGNEKYYFENPQVCMVFNAGELSLIEYGEDDVLGAVRTEYMNPHLLSVRLNDRQRKDQTPSRKLAYLVDPRTVAVLDLDRGVTVATIDNDSRLDWLELNETGRKLLFRDKRRRLHLYDLDSESRTAILSFCSYVQWVPGSDVVVAQNRDNLCIWYNIESPERVTTFPIKGDVVDIERVNGRTEVVVDEGVSTVSYALDEGLVEFGTAVEDGNYERAAAFLETLEMTSETETMWRTLAGLTLESRELHIAQRCQAALGDVARARYLGELNELVREAEETNPGHGLDHPVVRARLATLQRQFKLAETIYLEQGLVDDAIRSYQQLHKWEEALAVAEAKSHPQLTQLRADYERYLAETQQQERAAELKEQEGDMLGALTLYMTAGLPARAAQLVTRHDDLGRNPEVVERVAAALLKAGLYSHAGDLFDHVRMGPRALDCYRKARAYRKAVELARTSFPNEVVPLEEEWGDYLVTQKQMDAAINHFIEAGCTIKAIEAAINSRQWAKAAQVVELQDEAVARPYFKMIADHYAEAREFQQATKYYVAAKNPQCAIDMYIKAGKWQEAHSLATRHMRKEDVADLYLQQAEALEQKGKYKEAEKLYVTVNEPDYAINMYKKLQQYDDMVRLVKQHHPDLLDQTHAHLAKTLESQGMFTQAESHYVSANDWKAAVNMYRQEDMWEDAHRVAKQYGGPVAAQQIGYLWAMALGGESGVKLLSKFNMVEQAVDIACESGSFDFAFELARSAAKSKLPDVYLRHAMHLEDEGQFHAAEEEFIKAGRPKEAVLMYVHVQDWDSAQRIAEAHDKESVADVLVGQARVAFQEKDFSRAEGFLLRAQRPELAIKYYKEADMWPDVLRLAREYLPHLLQKLTEEFELEQARKGGRKDMYATAKMYEAQGNYAHAVDAFLKLTTEQTSDFDFLEEAWERAVELAIKFVSERATTVVSIVSGRLIQLDRHEPAAELYLGVDMVQEAINTYTQGHLFEKARALAKEQCPEMLPKVEAMYVEYLRGGGGGESSAEKLVSVDVAAGLDMYAQRGEWSRCLLAAEKEGGQVLNKYAALYAASLIQNGEPDKALKVFVKYGTPSVAQNFNIYRRICHDLFQRASELPYSVWAELRDCMGTMVAGLRTSGQADVHAEFDRLLLIAHYYALRCVCLAHSSLKETAAKLSISLLRYTEVIPADLAFYEAGLHAKACGWENMAFVFLNRYMDLCEAIDEGSLDSLDNTDFMGTDIPFEVPLPETPSVPEAKHDEIKEWVLAVSLDQRVEPVLEKDERGVFAGSLWCELNNKRAEPCVVSGYPVIGTAMTFNGRVALKQEWNKFVMASKSEHDPHFQDVFRFLHEWCGSPANPSYSFK
eukprot:m.226452 g.226452  ORF g.226452 m.226452 type:complete len:1747 (+) comp22359_c0_seq2:150-5390(+)